MNEASRYQANSIFETDGGQSMDFQCDSERLQQVYSKYIFIECMVLALSHSTFANRMQTLTCILASNVRPPRRRVIVA